MSQPFPGRGDMDDFYKYGAERVSTPNDLNSELPPVQNFAFGGIANPAQRAMLRGSDLAYLNQRQAELDAYEKERLAYNDALTKWQTEVYNPYKAQVEAYNTALAKYNEEVYNPYKAQVDAYNAAAQKYNADVYEPYKAQYAAYEKAIADWNAGPRETDYAGPAAPTLASQFTMAQPTLAKTFDMTAPTTPQEFSMAAPTTPFKEEDVKAYQQAAAQRAQKDAASRAVAIDVVSNPERFNFGSMSVAGRFMAKGGPTSLEDLAALNAANLADEEEAPINTNPVGTAQQMLADLSGTGQERTQYEASPTKQSVKRTRVTPVSGKGVKGMTMEYESLTRGDLGAMQDFKPKFKETDSARAQLEDLARQYQLKLSAVKNKARGLSANTFGAPTLEGPTLTKNTLAKRRFAEGGEVKDDEPRPTGVSRLVDFIAQKLPPEAFPTAGRTLLESVQGKKEPITEGSFSKDELEVLRRLTSKDKGSVSYEDYSRLAQQMRGEGQKNVDATASLFSLGSPLGNVRNTLGRFTYARDPQGNVVIVDKYDFNPPDQSQTQEARTADYGVFGPYNLIREYAGQKLPPGKGRDVRINLGAPIKRAKGSSRNN